MRRYSFFYFVGQSIQSLWRNGIMTIASILILMACLIVMGSFAALVININYNLESLDGLNNIIVTIDVNKSEDETLEIGERIKRYTDVSSVEYVSRAKAFEQMREQFNQDESTKYLLEGYDELNHPFPASYIVSYKDSKNIQTLVYELKETDGVTKVDSYIETASAIEGIKNTISFIFVWFLVILFVVSVFVIINTIKLAVFSRRQEISVMRYVGATNWFITFPFVLEGVLIGLLSSSMAYGIQWYLYVYVVKSISSDHAVLQFIPFSNIYSDLLIGFLAIGVITGIIGSVISIRRYLKA